MEHLHYDNLIIGFGKGGKTLAAKLAAKGETVALIEKDPAMYGGTCINVGCIPSKSLIQSSAAVDPAASFSEKKALYRAAIAEKRRLTAMLRQKNYDKLNNLPQVTIYNGLARFTASDRLEVATADGTLALQGEKVFINTGSTPRIPPIPGIETTAKVYTSAQLMDLEELPERLIIVGGGYIGLEFAPMYAGFGSKVTVLQDGAVFLPKEDRDVSAEIKKILEAQGVEFLLEAEITEIQPGPAVLLKHQGKSLRLEGDALLVATGRVPNTASLNCQAAGVDFTSRGAIAVDEAMGTSAPNVWAMGDVTGGRQHTYVSLDDSRIVWKQLQDDSSYTALNRENVPYSVFLSTPYARVGLNEEEAKAAGYSFQIAKLQTAAVPKAQVLNAPQGFLKAIVEKDTNRILGVMLLCPESYEMINLIKLAMDMGTPYTVLRDQVFTHPTMTEALNDLFETL